MFSLYRNFSMKMAALPRRHQSQLIQARKTYPRFMSCLHIVDQINLHHGVLWCIGKWRTASGRLCSATCLPSWLKYSHMCTLSMLVKIYAQISQKQTCLPMLQGPSVGRRLSALQCYKIYMTVKWTCQLNTHQCKTQRMWHCEAHASLLLPDRS